MCLFKSSKRALSLALALLLCAASAFAQNIRVSGRITEPDGTPVVGAAVFQNDARSNAVATSSDGGYSISVPSGATLLVTCIGYNDALVPVEGRSVVNIQLEISTEFLDDVVVTAQGLTRKQKAVGYSAQKLEGDELSTARVTDLNNALVGKVSGAQFWGKSGATFDSGSIVLRGTTNYSNPSGITTSSYSGNEPIYVVDGTITSANAVNMDDIESINVLKGPSATALYGSRGANGAIIITTAKGNAAGGGQVSFSHTTSVSVYRNEIDLNTLYGGGSTAANVTYLANQYGSGTYDYTSAEFLLGTLNGYTLDGGYYYDYASDENWGPRYDGTTNVASALYWDETSSKYHTFDKWKAQLDLKDLLQTGVNNTTNVAFSQSGKGYSARVSFTNVDMTGVMRNSEATRRFLSASLSLQPVKWLNADLSYKFTTRYTKNGASEGYSASGNVICDWTQWGHTNVNIADYKDYLRSDGTWRTWNIISTNDLGANFHDNPYATMDNYNRETSTNYHVFSADVYTKIGDNFRVGYRLNGNLTNTLYEAKYGSGAINFDPYYRQYQTNSDDYTHQAYVTYNDTFVDDRLTAEAALFAEQRAYNYYYLNSYTTDGLSADGFYNLDASNGTYVTNNTTEQFKTRSFFGTATFGWDDTYFLDLSLRNDLDSRLPHDNNSYLYGGGSVSVMLSQLIHAPWLNFWKVRGSLAQVGATLDAYDINKTYTIGTKHDNIATMYESSNQKNQNLLPSISTSYEVGTEFKLFGNRLYGDVNFYRKDTKNQIIDANVVAQSGYSTRKLNAGLIRNQGVEILLGGTPVKTRNFSWDISFNIAKNVNELVSLTEDQTERSIYGNKFYYYWYLKAIVGKPVGVITTMARWQRDDEGRLILRDGNSYWGDVRPTFETNTEKEVGNVQPDFTGGLSTSFSYKNLTLSGSLDFTIGGQFVSWTNMWGNGSGTLASSAVTNNNGVNVREAVADGGGVYVEGVDADGNPKSGYMDAYLYYHYLAYYDLDEWVYDRTYVKLREVSLAYKVPSKWLKGNLPFVSAASVAFVATNPWLIYSACPNIDPSEIAGATYGYIEGGQAISTRTFGLSVNVTF